MSALRSQAGFTLAELLVAMVLAALVLAGASVAFQTGSQIVLAGAEQAEAQQGARWAIERMIEEIRGTGYDPTAMRPTGPPVYHFDAITNQTATSLTLQSDWNGDGAIAAGACDLNDPTNDAKKEQVRYRLVGTTLMRSNNIGNNACEDTVVSGVQALTFTYLQEDDTVTAVSSNIRTVVISITVASEGTGPRRQVVMVDRVRLRNR